MKVLSVSGFSIRADQIIYIGPPWGNEGERYRNVVVQGASPINLSEADADELERAWREAAGHVAQEEGRLEWRNGKPYIVYKSTPAPALNIPLVPEKGE